MSGRSRPTGLYRTCEHNPHGYLFCSTLLIRSHDKESGYSSTLAPQGFSKEALWMVRESPMPCSRKGCRNTASDSERRSHPAHWLLMKRVRAAMPGKRRHTSAPRGLLLHSTTARRRPSGSRKAAWGLELLTMLAAAAIQAIMAVTMASQPPICTRMTLLPASCPMVRSR
jgi:hypothetical protein